MVLLLEMLFVSNPVSGAEFLQTMPAVLDNTPGDRFMEDIKQKKDLWEASAKEVLGKDDSRWEEHNRFLTMDRLIYVPPDKAL
jgi:hypothetical protein